MFALIRSLGSSAWGLAPDVIETIRRQIFKVIFILLALSVLGVALNFWGHKGANLYIGCALPLVALWLYLSPKAIGWMVFFGAVPNPFHPVNKTGAVMENVARTLSWFLLLASLFFLIAGTVQFSRNPGAVVVIYLTIGIMFLMDANWAMKTRIAKPILFGYVVFCLLWFFGSMISGASYKHWISFDPYNRLPLSKTQNMVYEIEELEARNFEEDRRAQLDVIRRKMERRQALTPAEQLFWQGERDRARANSIPGTVGGVVEDVFSGLSSLASPATAEATASVRYPPQSFTLKKGERFTTPPSPKDVTLTMVLSGGKMRVVYPNGSWGDIHPGTAPFTVTKGEESTFEGISDTPVTVNILEP